MNDHHRLGAVRTPGLVSIRVTWVRSSFRLTEFVHFSLGHDGTVRVSFDRPHCD